MLGDRGVLLCVVCLEHYDQQKHVIKRQRTSHRTYTTKKYNFTLTSPTPSLQNETSGYQHYSREPLMMDIVLPETCL